MPTISEGRLTFDFPNGWRASKLDEWSFYRNQFQRIGNVHMPCSDELCNGAVCCNTCGKAKVAGGKGIDILAVEPERCMWKIEIKDYRRSRRTKTIDLADEVALKMRDSLAVLAAAQANANDTTEKAMASAALRCGRMRVVLHLEQPAKHSKLFPRAISPANVRQRLKQLIKGIDPHPLVLEMNQMHGVGWSVH
jgi:hypothetical protein